MSDVRTGRNGRRWAPASALAFALAFVWADTPWAQTQGRVIYMATIEPRGGAQQDKEPFPATPLPAGEGYRKTPPDANGRWEVVTYQWSPGTIVVREGETVTLEIVGDVDVGDGPGRRDDDVELVLGRTLYEHFPAAGGAGHFFNGPLPVHCRPAFDPLRLEVELVSGHVVRHFELLRSVRRAESGPRPRARHDRSHRGFEHRSARDIHGCALLLGQHHQGALHVRRVLGTGDGIETGLGGREGDAGDFSALDGERVDKARDRRRVNIAVDPDDLQRHRLPLAHHDGPRRPLVGHDLPPPVRVRRSFSVPLACRQRRCWKGLLVLLSTAPRLYGRHVDHAPLGLRPWRVSPDGRQCQGEHDGRRPTLYVPPGPHVTHDSPLFLLGPTDQMDCSGAAPRSRTLARLPSIELLGHRPPVRALDQRDVGYGM